jgi:hypothetical protein
MNVGVTENEHADYLIITSPIDNELNKPTPYKDSIVTPKFVNVLTITLLKKPCDRMAAYGLAIDQMGGLAWFFDSKYTALIFVSSDSVGPLLPKFWPSRAHWSSIFTERLKQNVHAVGLLDCIKGQAIPRLSDVMFAASIEAVRVGWLRGVFKCGSGYEFASTLIENKMNLDTLMLNYGENEVDWVNASVRCDAVQSSAWKSHYRYSIHPFETVFFPIVAAGDSPATIGLDKRVFSERFEKELEAYMQWAVERNG